MATDVVHLSPLFVFPLLIALPSLCCCVLLHCTVVCVGHCVVLFAIPKLPVGSDLFSKDLPDLRRKKKKKKKWAHYQITITLQVDVFPFFGLCVCSSNRGVPVGFPLQLFHLRMAKQKL